MNATDHNLIREPSPPPQGLAQLGLSALALSALARQGFVTSEYRGERGPFFKLRFRLQGRQQVKYLGKDPHVAQQIAQELRVLQAPRQLDRELQQLAREARATLRKVKQDLAPLVGAIGRSFHGLVVRDRSKTEQTHVT